MISTRFTSKRNNKTQRLFSLALSLFFLVQTSSIFFLSAPADADLAESSPYSFASIEDWVDKANSSGNDLFAESQIAENCLDDDECEFLFFDFPTEEKYSSGDLYNSHLTTKRFLGTTSLSRGPPQA